MRGEDQHGLRLRLGECSVQLGRLRDAGFVEGTDPSPRRNPRLAKWFGLESRVYLSSRIAIAAVMIAWLCFVLTAGAGWERARIARRPGARMTRDQLAWAGFAPQASGFGLVWSFRRPTGSALVDVGLVGQWCITVAVAIAAFGAAGIGTWAIRALGRQFAVSARVVDGHELVTVGPYAHMRNPIYLALAGLLVATGLALSRGAPLLLGLVLYLAGTHLRARRKERLLKKAYGVGYETYARRVPRLLPWPLWRRRAA